MALLLLGPQLVVIQGLEDQVPKGLFAHATKLSDFVVLCVLMIEWQMDGKADTTTILIMTLLVVTKLLLQQLNLQVFIYFSTVISKVKSVISKFLYK